MTSTQPPPKRRRKSRFAPSPASPPSTSTSTQTDSLPPSNPAVKALRARLSSTLSSNQSTPPTKRPRTSRFAPVSDKPPPLQPLPPVQPQTSAIPVDLTSIPVAPVSTIRLNRNIAQARKLDSVLNVTTADLLSTDPKENPYFDAAITAEKSRVKRDLVFLRPGEVAEKAERRRAQREFELKNAQYRQDLLKGANDHSEMPLLPRVLGREKKGGEVPEWEWWDLPFLKSGGIGGDLQGIQVREDRITHYVHCPPELEEVVVAKKEVVVPLMLTKKETKKLRRQRRMEKQREKEEMIAAGLREPEAPKVKLSNMMRVLANEASADPTRVEMEVRKQVEERRKKHEMENLARKKTKEERKEKGFSKLVKDKEGGMMAAVFRVLSMEHPQHRFKVDINARQWNMTGLLLLFQGMNIVVVEGGRKTLRKYQKLMLRRIDWDAKVEGEAGEGKEKDVADKIAANGEIHDGDEEQEEGRRSNACVMVWEGPIANAAFNEFSTVRPHNPKECKQLFRKYNVEHYWDLCVQGNPIGNQNLGLRDIE